MSYGSLFQISDFSAAGTATRLHRIPLSSGRESGKYDEAWLQRLLSAHPQALPIAEIEPFLEGAIPVCIELPTNAGSIDLVMVSARGDVVLVECKLWRNPQARREVVGQIIDYAKELPRLSYDGFEAAIRKTEPASGIEKADSLYKRTGAEAAGVDEAKFVDAVIRNLRRGRFLLLIVGDGIQEGVENIVEFLQQHAGMHFTLALVEIAIFKSTQDGYLVQPRILAKTHMVPRGVVSIDDDRVMIRPDPRPGSVNGRKTAEPRTSISPSISEERLFELLDAKLPGGAARLRHLIERFEEVGVASRFTPTQIVLEGRVGDRTWRLGGIQADAATLYFEYVTQPATAVGRRDAALKYYRRLASVLRNPVVRAEKLNPNTRSGTAGLPLDDLLSAEETWLGAASEYLRALADVAGAQE